MKENTNLWSTVSFNSKTKSVFYWWFSIYVLSPVFKHCNVGKSPKGVNKSKKGSKVHPKYFPSSAQAIYSCPPKKILKIVGIGNLSDSRLAISSVRPTQPHWNKTPQLLLWSIKSQCNSTMYKLSTFAVFFLIVYLLIQSTYSQNFFLF